MTLFPLAPSPGHIITFTQQISNYSTQVVSKKTHNHASLDDEPLPFVKDNKSQHCMKHISLHASIGR